MRRRARLTIAAAALAGCTGLSGAGQPDSARFAGAVGLTATHPGAGGFSALLFAGAAPGGDFVTLSDRGTRWSGRIARDPATGRIVGATVTPRGPLTGPDGRTLAPKARDAEALAQAPDGTVFVAFEGVHRVLAYPPAGAPRALPPLPETDDWPPNGGVEALARADDGALLAIPERVRLPDGRVPVYRHHPDRPDTGWALRLRLAAPTPGFHPVAADIGPDGALYLLERRFSVFGGFATRLRRFAEAGAGPEEPLLATPSGLHDNLEGLAVWRDPGGGLRATMIADDNFFPLQRGEIVEYHLPPLARASAGR